MLGPNGTLNPIAIGMLQWGKGGTAQTKGHVGLPSGGSDGREHG